MDNPVKIAYNKLGYAPHVGWIVRFYLIFKEFLEKIQKKKTGTKIEYDKLGRIPLKAGVNLKFAQKLSFLFSSEFAALGIQLRYGKIIFYLFSLFLPFWAISKFPLWLMVWLPWQREEHFFGFFSCLWCVILATKLPNGQDLTRYFM